ncbi:tetratricopeptide repeat protein [Derxia gummosa]|uniref:Tetratricopeptide repeat protein n=1 Tax=Derxia gummosa DSM 723 TaxID=1121388 RepID=A0A8B6X9A2_9BURK|nr:tetratricopeptide repeat protein [Derxia gummosa]
MIFNRLRPLLAAAAVAACLIAATPARAQQSEDEAARIETLARQGDGSAALGRADSWIAAHPRDARVRFLRGVLLTDQQRIDDAIAAFTELNRDFPELAEPYNNLAVLLASQGRYDEARAALESAIRAAPGYALAWENLGDVYVQLAQRAYGSAARLAPANNAVPPKLRAVRAVSVAGKS